MVVLSTVPTIQTFDTSIRQINGYIQISLKGQHHPLLYLLFFSFTVCFHYSALCNDSIERSSMWRPKFSVASSRAYVYPARFAEISHTNESQALKGDAVAVHVFFFLFVSLLSIERGFALFKIQWTQCVLMHIELLYVKRIKTLQIYYAGLFTCPQGFRNMVEHILCVYGYVAEWAFFME